MIVRFETQPAFYLSTTTLPRAQYNNTWWKVKWNTAKQPRSFIPSREEERTLGKRLFAKRLLAKHGAGLSDS